MTKQRIEEAVDSLMVEALELMPPEQASAKYPEMPPGCPVWFKSITLDGYPAELIVSGKERVCVSVDSDDLEIYVEKAMDSLDSAKSYAEGLGSKVNSIDLINKEGFQYS